MSRITRFVRRLGHIALAGSAALALLLAFATVRSYRSVVVVAITWRDAYAVRVDHGVVQVLCGTNRAVAGDAASGYRARMLDWNAFEPNNVTTLFSGLTPREAALHTRITLPIWPPFCMAGTMGSAVVDVTNASGPREEFGIGRWMTVRSASATFLTLVFALPPFVATTRAIRRAVRRRPGTCVSCGYDLRASPAKCPECGQPVRPTNRPDLAYDRSDA